MRRPSALVALALTAGVVAAACVGSPTPTVPIVAVIRSVENQVETRAAAGGTPAPAAAGAGVPTGTTVRTGDQSAAVIDFGGANAIRLNSLTSITLLRIVQLGSGATVHLQLESGRLMGAAPYGWLVIETLLGQISLAGAAAHFEYAPGGFDPQDDVLIVRCLMNLCDVQSRLGSRTLAPQEQLVIADSGMTILESALSESEVAALLGTDSAGVLSAPTLTAWPLLQAQFTPTPSPTPSATPSSTPAVAGDTATPPPSPTRTRTPVLSATLTPTGTATATSTRGAFLATRTPTPSNTPTPTPVLVLPSATATETLPPPPPPPGPSSTPPPVPPTVAPTATFPPPATATPTQPEPPSKTPAEGPTKTPGPGTG